MNNIDLNIENYTLDDILRVFKIQGDFNEESLKKAKKQVYMTHPDKSNLDKEYFLFFSAAYRLLYKVYKVNVMSKQDTKLKRTYVARDIDEEQDNAEIWSSISKHSQFNDIFNEMFDKNISSSKSVDGYGDWLKEEDTQVSVATSRDEMNNMIDARKKTLSALVEYKGVIDTGGDAGTALVEDVCSYKSGMFSSLQFDDIKQVYTESVIPVSEEDYEKREKYQSVDHLQRCRREGYSESTKHHNNHNILLSEYAREEGKKDIARAFSLAKQDEEMIILRCKIASNFLKITHS
jgi:hypothetical protein